MTAPPPLQPVHEDPYLLVLDKPAGLLCVPGRGEDKQDCLSARAVRQWPDALIVHRLDMATSGLVVMARGIEMQRALSAAFADRVVHKRYEAIVDGAMPLREEWSLIDAPLIADWPQEKLDAERARGGLIEAEEVAEAVYFMLTRPRNVTIRDLVILPQSTDL